MRKLIKQIGLTIAMISTVLFVNMEAKAATSTDGYTYTVDSTTNEATITGYTGSATELNISSSVDGFKVTSIGTAAFSGKSNITKVTLPNTLKILGKRSFEFCTGLTAMEIPDGCTAMGTAIFLGCDDLTTVIIPKSVTTMDYIDSGNEIFGSIGILTLNVYLTPGSAAEIYMNTYKSGYHYYYLDEYSPSSVTFKNPTITINVGDTYTFQNSDFNVLPSTAYITKPSCYTTSDQYVAYVSLDGLLTAKKVGTVIVNATISDTHLKNSVSTTTPITINVVENRKAVESVSLNVDSNIDMYVGDTLQLNATAMPK